MKKKTKIIIAIIISILLIITICIFGVNELSKYHTYTVTITNIEGENIIVEDSSNLIPYELYEGITDEEIYYGHKVTKEDKVYVTAKYQLYAKNVLIKDNNGNKINSSDLNIGDTLYIITKDEEYKADIVYSIERLQNVKLIKVLDNNSTNFAQKYDNNRIVKIMC